MAESSKGASQSAPWHRVPDRSFVNVEHPFLVKDVSKAVDTLGGAQRVRKLVAEENVREQAELFLHPDNRISKSISSGNVKGENLILQLTLPKRTGRWRKKGSLDPFEGQPESSDSSASDRAGRPHQSAEYVMQSLRDNPQHHSFKIIGRIENTHRFRSLPDFVFSTTKNRFLEKFHQYVGPLDYDAARRFSFDLSKGPSVNTDLVPPPIFSHYDIPFNYQYQQNPAVRQIRDESGNITTINESAARRVKTQHIRFDHPHVPIGPAIGTLPIDSLEEEVKEYIERAKVLMDERPIWTRRALSNRINSDRWSHYGKHVYQYIGYEFRSGPWRDTVINYGVDPRSDPKYRIYQTMAFQFESEVRIGKDTGAPPRRRGVRAQSRTSTLPNDLASGRNSHIFDGANLMLDGKVWQVCDITDPILRSVLDTTNIPPTCHKKINGWYYNGTWAKFRVIARKKMNAILGEEIDLREEEYRELADLPDVIGPGTRTKDMFSNHPTSLRAMELASQIRSNAIQTEPEHVRGISPMEEDEELETEESEGDQEESDEEMVM